MRKITHLVVHTSASYNKNKGVLDPSAADIDAMHKAKGWAGIGYHYVIRRSGKVEKGRALEKVGAHVLGFNTGTVGVCCSGHGDYADFTPEQKDALTRLLADTAERVGLAGKVLANPLRVLGHAEVGKWRHALALMIGNEIPDPHKSCPGRLVDMAAVRTRLVAELKRRAG